MAGVWEMAIKNSRGLLTFPKPFEEYIRTRLDETGFLLLPVDIRHTATVAALPFHHKGPFDRMIIAQGMAESLPIVSVDAAFDADPVRRVW